MLAIRAERPYPIERVLEYSTLLDEYGVAGFSWGIVWKTPSGDLQRYRAVEGIRRDPLATRALTGVQSTEYLVHLRRPSLMTTISHRNAQPYLATDGSFAFAHNGFFARHRDWRPNYRDQLEGTSDSEVGHLFYHSQLAAGTDAAQALVQTHHDLEGGANIGVIRRGSPSLFYAGNHENHVYSFEMDSAKMIATALHSADDYLFQSVFPQAGNIERVPIGTVCTL